jgi:hypothetical protein
MVTEQLLLLVQMQGIDRELLQHKEDAKRLPETLRTAEETLKNLEGDLEKARNAVTQLEKKKKKEELEIKVCEEHIIQLREKLPRLKTNEEYKALLNEIEAAKTRKRNQEDSLLVFMEEDETIRKEIGVKEQAVIEGKRLFAIQKQEIDVAISQLAVQASSVEERSTVLSEQIEKELLAQYKNLLIVCKGLSVAPLSGNICTGCNFSIPPQKVAEVKKGEQLHTCTYCNRILYIPVKTG